MHVPLGVKDIPIRKALTRCGGPPGDELNGAFDPRHPLAGANLLIEANDPSVVAVEVAALPSGPPDGDGPPGRRGAGSERPTPLRTGQATGLTFSVQKLQRRAALGMVLRHCGHSRVVTSTGSARRAASLFIGTTTMK